MSIFKKDKEKTEKIDNRRVLCCYRCPEFLTIGSGIEGICAVDGEPCTCITLCTHNRVEKEKNLK